MGLSELVMKRFVSKRSLKPELHREIVIAVDSVAVFAVLRKRKILDSCILKYGEVDSVYL